MRLLSSIAVSVAALFSGLTAAASQSADVFLFTKTYAPSKPPSELPVIQKEIVRHIILQRTSRQPYGDDLCDLSSRLNIKTAIDQITTYGKNPTPLFEAEPAADPLQLVIILEGVSHEGSKWLRKEAGDYLAFTIANPPSASANNELMIQFQDLGITRSKQCEIPASFNPHQENCWSGTSSVVKYDLKTNPKVLNAFFDNLHRLHKFVNTGDIEVLLIALPESTRYSWNRHWSTAACLPTSLQVNDMADLKRRAKETVISNEAETDSESDSDDEYETESSNTSGNTSPVPTAFALKKSIPSCFTSYASCMNQTNNCSGHGECVNKYGSSSTTTDSKGPTCFTCMCKASRVDRGEDAKVKGKKTIHWGGNMCHREDISVPFLLFVGFTVTMVGAISFCISLLFQVGEEKLPGVIGAGVARK